MQFRMMATSMPPSGARVRAPRLRAMVPAPTRHDHRLHYWRRHDRPERVHRHPGLRGPGRQGHPELKRRRDRPLRLWRGSITPQGFTLSDLDETGLRVPRHVHGRRDAGRHVGPASGAAASGSIGGGLLSVPGALYSWRLGPQRAKAPSVSAPEWHSPQPARRGAEKVSAL